MIQGAVITQDCFILRWHNPHNKSSMDDRLLLVNFARDLHWRPSAEPLVAPAVGTHWQIVFSSEDPQYGGSGTALLKYSGLAHTRPRSHSVEASGRGKLSEPDVRCSVKQRNGGDDARAVTKRVFCCS